jgi:hypothetical protein
LTAKSEGLVSSFASFSFLAWHLKKKEKGSYRSNLSISSEIQGLAQYSRTVLTSSRSKVSIRGHRAHKSLRKLIRTRFGMKYIDQKIHKCGRNTGVGGWR